MERNCLILGPISTSARYLPFDLSPRSHRLYMWFFFCKTGIILSALLTSYIIARMKLGGMLEMLCKLLRTLVQCKALLWLLLFQVQQGRLDLGKMADSPGWRGGEPDLFLYQQIT